MFRRIKGAIFLAKCVNLAAIHCSYTFVLQRCYLQRFAGDLMGCLSFMGWCLLNGFIWPFFGIHGIYAFLGAINSRIHERNHQILLEMHHRDQLQGMCTFWPELLDRLHLDGIYGIVELCMRCVGSADFVGKMLSHVCARQVKRSNTHDNSP